MCKIIGKYDISFVTASKNDINDIKNADMIGLP